MMDESTEMRVDRCDCLGRRFAELLRLGSLEAALAEGVGGECEGCLPYLRLAFETGETEFAVDDPRIEW